MATSTAIITGANSGLGLATTQCLAKNHPNLHLILACRNIATAQDEVNKIQESNPNTSVEIIKLDLGDLASIREFGATIKEKRESNQIPPISIILANAGGQFVTNTTTKDGFEATFGANVLGHFLFTHLLLRVLDPAHPTRIIYTASSTHDPEVKTRAPPPEYKTPNKLAYPDADERDPAFIGIVRYTNSKLGNILQAYELARRTSSVESLKSVTVNAFDPGLMFGTSLARNRSATLNFMFTTVLPYTIPIFRYFNGNVRYITESAESLTKLATDPEYNGVTGKYFQQTNDIPSSKDSYDENKQRELWEESIKLVGLKQDETAFTL
jgi:NAD(P)-dependent dehydrogenase (short-subunit alcohol dehydrogenase family)